MRYLAIVVMLIASHVGLAQLVELKDTSGNRYIGKLYMEELNQVCLETKNKHILCFDSLSFISYGIYKPYHRAYPLTKELNPIVISHDIGGLYRNNYAGSGGFYCLSVQKRIDNHFSAGLRGSISIGDFLEYNVGAIGTFQFNPENRYVSTVSLTAGTLKDFVYWTTGGFDVNAEYALLLRKERNKSGKLFFSAGLHSAKYNLCSGIDCEETVVRRSSAVQLRAGYGWQF